MKNKILKSFAERLSDNGVNIDLDLNIILMFGNQKSVAPRPSFQEYFPRPYGS